MFTVLHFTYDDTHTYLLSMIAILAKASKVRWMTLTVVALTHTITRTHQVRI